MVEGQDRRNNKARVGAPVSEVPGVRSYTSKYSSIYEAVDLLKADEWLPITFDSDKQARTFQCTVITHRTRKMEAVVRGSVVYVRNQALAAAQE